MSMKFQKVETKEFLESIWTQLVDGILIEKNKAGEGKGLEFGSKVSAG